MQVTAAVKKRVETKLKECIATAEKRYNQTFRFPTVLYTQRGTTAGCAVLQRWEVNFNAILLMENVEDFLERTVPHEMAHLMDFQMNPENFESRTTWVGGRMRRTKRDVHGFTWQTIMMVLGADPSRCHSYDTSKAKFRNKTHHVWVCKDCGTRMELGPQRHTKMQSGRARYWKRGCGHHRTGYEYIGIAGQENSMPKAANEAKKPKTPKPKAPARSTGKASKLDACRDLYSSVLSREENIRSFISAGCTPAGAATYYAKIKKERG